MAQMITHKATPECPITQPHSEEICGHLQARRRRSEQANAANRKLHEEEASRLGKRDS